MQQQIALDIPVCPETPTKLYVKRHLLLAIVIIIQLVFALFVLILWTMKQR